MRLIPRTLMLEITRLCNLRCEYCYHYSMKRVKGREWSRFCLPEALLSKFNISDVVITGGEPLLEYNKLIQILEYYSNIILIKVFFALQTSWFIRPYSSISLIHVKLAAERMPDQFDFRLWNSKFAVLEYFKIIQKNHKSKYFFEIFCL